MVTQSQKYTMIYTVWIPKLYFTTLLINLVLREWLSLRVLTWTKLWRSSTASSRFSVAKANVAKRLSLWSWFRHTSCQTELRVGMQSMLGVVPVQIRGLSMQLPQMLNSWFNTNSLHISIRNMFSFLGLATGGIAWAVLAWFQKANLQRGTELRSIHMYLDNQLPLSQAKKKSGLACKCFLRICMLKFMPCIWFQHVNPRSACRLRCH